MKFNGNLFYFLTVFYLVDAAGYIVWQANTDHAFEPIGSAAIAMLGVMSLFLGFYLKKTANSQGPVPDDRLAANSYPDNQRGADNSALVPCRRLCWASKTVDRTHSAVSQVLEQLDPMAQCLIPVVP